MSVWSVDLSTSKALSSSATVCSVRLNRVMIDLERGSVCWDTGRAERESEGGKVRQTAQESGKANRQLSRPKALAIPLRIHFL
eukprot:854918-Rhodomonas_salina.1